MAWLENVANLFITGAICTYAVYDFFRERDGQQQGQAREGTSSSSRSQTTVSNNGWTTVQQTGPGWQSTVYTFGDSSDPGVLTLHNLLGNSGDRREQLPFENNMGGGGQSDVMRLLQQLQQDFSSPQLQLAGAGARDFTEADYEMLSALDNGSLRRRTPVTEADVSALPTHIYCAHGKGAAEGAEEEELETCSICLDDFMLRQEVKTLPCLHHFHTGCIEEWLRQQGRSVSCPVCKTPVFEGQNVPW